MPQFLSIMAYVIMPVLGDLALHVVMLPNVLPIGAGFPLFMILELIWLATAFSFRYSRFFSLQ